MVDVIYEAVEAQPLRGKEGATFVTEDGKSPMGEPDEAAVQLAHNSCDGVPEKLTVFNALRPTQMDPVTQLKPGCT